MVRMSGLAEWLRPIPLTRPLRKLERDLADGLLVAEICHHHFPRLVNLLDFGPMQTAESNWKLLNRKH